MTARRGGAGLLLYALAAVALAGSGDEERTLRDPLQPPTRNAERTELDTSRWTLSSTLVAAGRRVAIINGRSVQPGDRVDGASVVAVTRKGARLRAGGRIFELRPATRAIKRRAQTRLLPPELAAHPATRTDSNVEEGSEP